MNLWSSRRAFGNARSFVSSSCTANEIIAKSILAPSIWPQNTVIFPAGQGKTFFKSKSWRRAYRSVANKRKLLIKLVCRRLTYTGVRIHELYLRQMTFCPRGHWNHFARLRLSHDTTYWLFTEKVTWHTFCPTSFVKSTRYKCERWVRIERGVILLDYDSVVGQKIAHFHCYTHQTRGRNLLILNIQILEKNTRKIIITVRKKSSIQWQDFRSKWISIVKKIQKNFWKSLA